MVFKRSTSVDIFTKQIKDYLSDDFIIVKKETDIGVAIEKLKNEKKSVIIVHDNNLINGIITERDILNKITFNADPKDRVDKFMSTPVQFVFEDDLLFHCIGQMRKYNFRHMPVLNSLKQVVGIIHLPAALSAELGSLMESIDRVTTENTEDGIIKIKTEQTDLAWKLYEEQVNPLDISYLLSFLNNIIYRRCIDLATERVAKKKIIKTIPNYCVLTMGSGGRMESYLHPDQDNGIIYETDNASEETLKNIDQYFYELANEFTILLDRAGIPLCKGDLMATNPLWRKSLKNWKEQINNWVQKPNDDSLRYMDMLYDFRAIYGDANLAKNLRNYLLNRLEESPQFLKYLYKRDEGTNAAIGFFGQFILEKEDQENLGMLNLKHTGTLPLVESIRMYSMKNKVDSVSTLVRLSKLTALGVFTESEEDFFRGAFKFLSNILLKNQIIRSKENKVIKNFIDPRFLTSREKSILKIYLKKIKDLKLKLKGDFGEEYV